MRSLRPELDQLTAQQKHRARSDGHAPARVVISVVLTPEAQTNPDVVACTVEAIQSLPNVADVTTRRVWARSNGASRPEKTA
jgi:hypothetical protein